jgi:hypothetical protein
MPQFGVAQTVIKKIKLLESMRGHRAAIAKSLMQLRWKGGRERSGLKPVQSREKVKFHCQPEPYSSAAM